MLSDTELISSAQNDKNIRSAFTRPYIFILSCAAVFFILLSVGVNLFLFNYAQQSTLAQLEKRLQEQISNLDLLIFSMIQGFSHISSIFDLQPLLKEAQIRQLIYPFFSTRQQFYAPITFENHFEGCLLYGDGFFENISSQGVNKIAGVFSYSSKIIPDFLNDFPEIIHVSYVSKDFNLICPWDSFPPVVNPEWIQDTRDLICNLSLPLLYNKPHWSPLSYRPHEKIWSVEYVLPAFQESRLDGFFVFNLPQQFFIEFFKHFKLPFGKVFLIDQENAIMASLEAGEAPQERVSFLKKKLPPQLMKDGENIFHTKPGQIKFYHVGMGDGFWSCVIPLQKAPWKLIFVGSLWDVAQSDVKTTFSDTFMLMLTVLLMVILSYILMKTYFINPSFKLIQHLDQERQGIESNVSVLPSAWQPWGNLISSIFDENRHLVSELETRVQERTHALKKALSHLQDSQDQVVAQEKLASLGTVVAGIAHEIKNPLNFVLNFAQISRDILDELKQDKKASENESKNLETLEANLEKIIEYADRADYIVKSMLMHARSSPSALEETHMNRFVDEYADLCYQSFMAQNHGIPIRFEKDLDQSVLTIKIYPQEMGRVLLNLLNNAFETVAARFEKEPQDTYKPYIFVKTQNTEEHVMIMVHDNGEGIPPSILKKIFDPFFSTKAPGKGTGLGLSISYDCVQRHRGSLEVESREGEGSWFFIRIPKDLGNNPL